MHNSKLIDVLIDKGLILSFDQYPMKREKMSYVPYASVIGSLMYGMLCAQPDMCFVHNLMLRGFSYTNLGGNPDKSKSTSGRVFTLIRDPQYSAIRSKIT